MTQRQKLIELINNADKLHGSVFAGVRYPLTIAQLTDYLLDNGVIVLPCKIGDTVYLINDGKIYEATVYRIEYVDHDQSGIGTTVSARTQLSYSFGICFDDFGKTAFLTREEAEATLKRWAREVEKW